MFAGRDVRSDFPTLHQLVGGRPLVYLDNAATTHKPQVVIDALARYYEKDNSNVHRGLHALSMRATDGYEAARARTAVFVNASSPSEIIFTRGTTESVNLVAQSWGQANLKRGDVILLTEMELGKTFLRLLDIGEGADADLASYLLFDGDFATRLVDLGRRDAEAKRDELADFLFGTQDP